MTNLIKIPNASNGLPLVPRPWRHVCYFKSCHGEHAHTGYFDHSAISTLMLIEMLEGQSFEIVDGTTDGKIPKAFLCGLLCFVYVWEYARLGKRLITDNELPILLPQDGDHYEFASECLRVAITNVHKRFMLVLTKLASIVGRFPALKLEYQDGCVVTPVADDIVTLRLSWQKINFDDKPERIREKIYGDK